MKKLKVLLCMTLLSLVFVGNAFASGSSGGGVFSFLAYAAERVVALLKGDPCPLRQCTNCRPTEKDENGNCRPRD